MMAHGGTLKSRALRAGGWQIIGVVGDNVLRLVSNLIMTRLLLPEAFGLMMLVSTVLTAFNLVTDLGIHRSIVRAKSGDTPLFLQVAWTLKLRRGAVIAVGLLLLAGLASLIAPVWGAPGSVYSDPRLPGLLALVALSPFLMGLESTSKELLDRHLDYARQTVVTFAVRVITIGIMVVAGMIAPSVWVLMLGMLSSNLMMLAASHLMFRGPRMRWTRDAAIEAELWHFGRFIVWSSAFTFVGSFADRLIVGGLIQAEVFGYYAVAMLLVEAGRAVALRISDRVALPVLSEVSRSRPHDLDRVFGRMSLAFDGISFLAFLGAAMLGPWVLILLYPERYIDAAGMLVLLSIGFLTLRFQMFSALLLNLGNSKAQMFVQMANATAVLLGMPLAFKLAGLEGMLLANGLASLAGVPVQLFHLRGILSNRQIIHAIAWVILTLFMALMIYSRAALAGL